MLFGVCRQSVCTCDYVQCIHNSYRLLMYSLHVGAIELSILSDSYETELHVVDVQTNRIDKFGMLK